MQQVILQNYRLNGKTDLFLTAFSILGLPNVKNTLTAKEDLTTVFTVSPRRKHDWLMVESGCLCTNSNFLLTRVAAGC